MPQRILGVIPARYASSRFPGKPLVSLGGKTMLQHVWERACQARYLTKVLIATDDQRIAAEARRFGADVRLTLDSHPTGTDRVAEVASADPASLIVNIQGDEPLIDPGAIDTAVLAIDGEDDLPMATLMRRIEDPRDFDNPNCVKVVTDRLGNAIYFSRSTIPFNRGGGAVYFQHVGLYVYRRDFLLGYSDLPVGPLEKAECLEQLRALENGYRIRVAETEYLSLGVDTPDDLERLRGFFEASLQRIKP